MPRRGVYSRYPLNRRSVSLVAAQRKSNRWICKMNPQTGRISLGNGGYSLLAACKVVGTAAIHGPARPKRQLQIAIFSAPQPHFAAFSPWCLRTGAPAHFDAGNPHGGSSLPCPAVFLGSNWDLKPGNTTSTIRRRPFSSELSGTNRCVGRSATDGSRNPPNAARLRREVLVFVAGQDISAHCETIASRPIAAPVPLTPCTSRVALAWRSCPKC